jgi:hypothetical protein
MKVVQHLAQQQKFRITGTFKWSIKENNHSNKTCWHIHGLLCYKTSVA